jgi:arylsulfatase A-like enzyme
MPKPNLLFIFTDEQRADTMAAYGNNVIQTPNLNRLSESCHVFDRTYVTQPVCTPSRASIMTGRWPHTCGLVRNNISLPVDTPCLPEMLPSGDYATAYHGKWHLGDELFAQHGFDEWVSIEDGYTNNYSPGRDKSTRSDYDQWVQAQGVHPHPEKSIGRSEATRLPEQYGKPAFLAQESSRFIRENKDRPFCLYTNFLEPHMPFFGPRDDQHDHADITMPINFDNPPTDDQPLRARFNYLKHLEKGDSDRQLRTEADWRRQIANYWGLCSLVDTHVGTILQTLEECGLYDDTIIVYTSDHGDMMGSHRMLAKTVMFEEAVKVPLLVKLPGQDSCTHVARPVSQVDLVPTLLDLMGADVADHLDGTSLAPLMDGDTPEPEDVIIEWNGTDGLGAKAREDAPEWQNELGTPEEVAAELSTQVRGILTPDGHKFNCRVNGDHELYDLNADPGETRNLASDASQTDRMRDMLGRIRRWQDDTGDEVELPEV